MSDPQVPASGDKNYPPVPSKAAPMVLSEDSLDAAARKVLRFHYGRMLANEPGARLGEDIEAVHDVRVAIRRMRVAFGVFEAEFGRKETKPLRKRLRKTGRVLGAVRDLDVFLEKTEPYRVDLTPADRAGLDPLLVDIHQRRDAARERMLAFLDGPRYGDLLARFEHFLNADPGDIQNTQNSPTAAEEAPRLAQRWWLKVNTYRPASQRTAYSELHQLRITLKKLRYTLEFFRNVLNPRSRKIIGEIKRIQDHLGDLNDASVASRILQEYLNTAAGSPARGALVRAGDQGAVVNYLAFRHAEREHLLRTFPEVWAWFNRRLNQDRMAIVVARQPYELAGI